MWVRSLPVKSRKGLARDVADDVTDTDYWAQNGTNNGNLFAIIIIILTDGARNRVKRKKEKKEKKKSSHKYMKRTNERTIVRV